VLGSFGAGIISDKIFRGHRSPVAMTLYFLETLVILTAVLLIELIGIKGVFLSCLFLVLISLTANSTHSIVGAAAPMDIGGRKMAGFAAGVIDSFQYFGAGIAFPVMGKLLVKYGWVTWFPAMAGFGFLGGVAMLLVMRKQKIITKQQTAPVTSTTAKA
jgi:OPA family glycerol-3-phosphate transporter-like MFS transporter